MPKGMRESSAEEKVAGPSCVVNPRQAESHKLHLDQAIKELQERAKEEEIEEIMEPFINKVKEYVQKFTPQWNPLMGRKYYML